MPTSIKLNDVLLEENILLYATNLKHLERAIGRNIDGIIGFDLLQHYGVKIDYTNSKIYLFEGETYDYTGIGQKFEMDLEKSIPFMTAETTLNNGEQLSGQYFVNTGAATTVDFNTRYALSNDIINKTGKHYSYLVKGLSSSEALHYEGRVQKFQFGKIHFEEMPIDISQSKRGIQGHKKIAGIIGNKIMKNFNVIFNYTKEAIYFERHIGTKMVFPVNSCGFEFEWDESGENVVISRVFQIGPAIEGRLEVGNKIVSINGISPTEMTIPQMKNVLNTPETTVELVVKGYRIEKAVTLELKEII